MSRRLRPLRQRPVPAAAETLARDGLDPLLSRLYAARGVADPRDLDYGLRGLLPVGTLEGVDAAVALVRAHRDKRVTVIGDFDADGATSTALVLRCLRDLGFSDVGYLVPNRFEYGYGLTPEIVREAARRSPSLLITVDNGVSSVEGVAEAHRLGIGVVVTDHHLPGRELPAADAMVNPNLEGSVFGSRNLAGVGVAFYLMAALGRALEEDGQAGAARIAARYLDLVALGTVADVVRLDRNNRILVSQGLARIRSGHCVPGITALFRIAGRSAVRAVSTDLGFVVGPRLNAAGRLEDMSVGIECLLSDDPAAADRLAATLDDINRDRKTIESDMRRQAYEIVDRLDESNLPACVCLFEPSWHQGVVGLVAARVRERCDRPVIAFAEENGGMLKGSARSVPGVHARDLLEAVATGSPGIIERFGGHAMAAGLTLRKDRFPAFREQASRTLLALYPDADFSGAILTDGDLPGSALNLQFARALREAGPWGAGFQEPVFCGHFVVEEQRTVGDSHLKMRVRPAAGGMVIDAIAFNQAGQVYRGTVQLTYRLDVNEFRGNETPQLVVEQIVNIASTPC